MRAPCTGCVCCEQALGNMKDTNLSALGRCSRAWVTNIFICWPLGTNTKHTILCNVLEACHARWAREMRSCKYMVLSTGHLCAISIQYSLIQCLVIRVFYYISLVTVRKYQMGSSRNEQLLSSKLVANQSSILDSHTAMVHPVSNPFGMGIPPLSVVSTWSMLPTS